jgi:hypothetical protein
MYLRVASSPSAATNVKTSVDILPYAPSSQSGTRRRTQSAKTQKGNETDTVHAQATASFEVLSLAAAAECLAN